MANTLIGQTSYSYGTGNTQTTTATDSLGQTYYTVPYNNQLGVQPYYYQPVMSEAEKAGKALAIMKELEAEGLIAPFESVAKFCEMIDKIASKL